MYCFSLQSNSFKRKQVSLQFGFSFASMRNAPAHPPKEHSAGVRQSNLWKKVLITAPHGHGGQSHAQFKICILSQSFTCLEKLLNCTNPRRMNHRDLKCAELNIFLLVDTDFVGFLQQITLTKLWVVQRSEDHKQRIYVIACGVAPLKGRRQHHNSAVVRL